jgi:hypothetical protein
MRLGPLTGWLLAAGLVGLRMAAQDLPPEMEGGKLPEPGPKALRVALEAAWQAPEATLRGSR